MTSCLGEVSSNYTESAFVYLDRDDMGQAYGKTFSRYSQARLITSNSMMSMQPGSIKFMGYSWDEKMGNTPLMIGGQTNYFADNVEFVPDVVDITSNYLHFSELPESEVHAGLNELTHPLYADSRDYINDFWVFEYSCYLKKGETANVEFYKRNQKNDKGEVVIDVHLSITGTPEEQTAKIYVDAVAVNMSQLRSMFEGTDNTLSIKFKYYKSDSSGDVAEAELQTTKWVLNNDNSNSNNN